MSLPSSATCSLGVITSFARVCAIWAVSVSPGVLVLIAAALYLGVNSVARRRFSH
nr:hypothetical protein [Streptomyces globisporus]